MMHDNLSPSPCQAGAFSLFSPGTSTDLLSGIRKHLSKIDLNEPEEPGK